MKKILKIIAMLFVIAAVVFAAGCAEKTETAGNETQEDSEQVPPATPETSNMIGENVTENNTAENNTTQPNETVETGQVVTEADSGKTISLKNGDYFTLQLRENPSTGYSWQLNLSEGLSILSDGYTQDPAPEDKVGVPGNHRWEIKAVTPGSQQVNGIYKQPWENTTGTEGNFTLTVEVV